MGIDETLSGPLRRVGHLRFLHLLKTGQGSQAACTADNDGDGEDLHPLCRLVPIVHKIYESFPKEITLRGKCLEIDGPNRTAEKKGLDFIFQESDIGYL